VMRTGQHLSTLSAPDMNQSNSKMACDLDLARFKSLLSQVCEVHTINVNFIAQGLTACSCKRFGASFYFDGYSIDVSRKVAVKPAMNAPTV
jgi:hypothetical protein